MHTNLEFFFAKCKSKLKKNYFSSFFFENQEFFPLKTPKYRGFLLVNGESV